MLDPWSGKIRSSCRGPSPDTMNKLFKNDLKSTTQLSYSSLFICLACTSVERILHNYLSCGLCVKMAFLWSLLLMLAGWCKLKKRGIGCNSSFNSSSSSNLVWIQRHLSYLVCLCYKKRHFCCVFYFMSLSTDSRKKKKKKTKHKQDRSGYPCV